MHSQEATVLNNMTNASAASLIVVFGLNVSMPSAGAGKSTAYSKTEAAISLAKCKTSANGASRKGSCAPAKPRPFEADPGSRSDHSRSNSSRSSSSPMGGGTPMGSKSSMGSPN